MCGRYVLRTPAPALVQIFMDDAPPSDALLSLPPRYNVAPTDEMPIVRVSRRTGQRQIVTARWGLVPFWARDVRIGSRLINARVESVFEKPAFRDSLKSRRCLIPADGFIEWRREGRARVPFFIGAPDGRVLAFAGLWARHGEGPSRFDSFTILTGPASDDVASVHDRMPVILTPDAWSRWLDVDVEDVDIAPMSVPYRGRLDLVEVSPRINSVKHDDPACLSPAAPAEPRGQLGLFDS